jgi:hypothetical protein
VYFGQSAPTCHTEWWSWEFPTRVQRFLVSLFWGEAAKSRNLVFLIFDPLGLQSNRCRFWPARGSRPPQSPSAPVVFKASSRLRPAGAENLLSIRRLVGFQAVASAVLPACAVAERAPCRRPPACRPNQLRQRSFLRFVVLRHGGRTRSAAEASKSRSPEAWRPSELENWNCVALMPTGRAPTLWAFFLVAHRCGGQSSSAKKGLTSCCPAAWRPNGFRTLKRLSSSPAVAAERALLVRVSSLVLSGGTAERTQTQSVSSRCPPVWLPTELSDGVRRGGPASPNTLGRRGGRARSAAYGSSFVGCRWGGRRPVVVFKANRVSAVSLLFRRASRSLSWGRKLGRLAQANPGHR